MYTHYIFTPQLMLIDGDHRSGCISSNPIISSHYNFTNKLPTKAYFIVCSVTLHISSHIVHITNTRSYRPSKNRLSRKSQIQFVDLIKMGNNGH